MKGDFFMKNATHRVVILKDFNSELISQAIIFLKDSCSESEAKILEEAEKVVEKYMQTQKNPPTETCRKHSKLTKTFVKIASVGVFSLIAIGIIVALV